MRNTRRQWMAAGACLALAAAHALAQSFPTDVPAGATALNPDQLRERIQDKVFIMQTAAGQTIRIENKGAYAYINIGSQSDSGPWRVEGSTVCNDWRRFPGGCAEVRLAGDVLYIKRLSNQEVVAMTPQR